MSAVPNPKSHLLPPRRLSRGRRKPGSGKGQILYVAPDAFKPLDELPIGEIREWLPYMFTDAEIAKLQRADPRKSPKQVLKGRQRRG